MTSEVHLSRVEDEFREHSYPVAHEDLVDSCAGTTVLFADGDADLGELVADIDQERFESAEDAFTALQNVLPIEALSGSLASPTATPDRIARVRLIRPHVTSPHGTARLASLFTAGRALRVMSYRIGLVGKPSVGKSTFSTPRP